MLIFFCWWIFDQRFLICLVWHHFNLMLFRSDSLPAAVIGWRWEVTMAITCLINVIAQSGLQCLVTKEWTELIYTNKICHLKCPCYVENVNPIYSLKVTYRKITPLSKLCGDLHIFCSTQIFVLICNINQFFYTRTSIEPYVISQTLDICVYILWPPNKMI